MYIFIKIVSYNIKFLSTAFVISYIVNIFPCLLKKLLLFIYLFLAALGLRCCVWAFSSCSEQGLLIVEVRGLLIAVASLVTEHGL